MLWFAVFLSVVGSTPCSQQDLTEELILTTSLDEQCMGILRATLEPEITPFTEDLARNGLSLADIEDVAHECVADLKNMQTEITETIEYTHQ